MQTKLLSIIIPTYNMEPYLRHCLDSLIIDKGMDELEVLLLMMEVKIVHQNSTRISR